jgi:hypothetical protein
MAKKLNAKWVRNMAKKSQITQPITDMAYDATVRKAIQTGTMECPECGPVEEGRENGCHLCGPTEKFVVSEFAKSHFDATKHAPAIPQTLEEFEMWLNAERPLFVRDGYAPFCKLRFYYNNTKAKASIISLEGENAGFQSFIQTKYEARRETELPVLVRSLPSEIVNIRAKYLCVIVYDKEQMAKEGNPIEADFAVVNFLALIGWNPGGEKELFSREELLAAFDLSGIHTHGGVFNEEKLRWFQKEHLSRLDDAAFTTYVRPAIPQEVSDDMLAHMLPILRERTVLSSEIAQLWPAEYAWVTQAPAPEPAKLTWKDSTPEESRGILSETRSRLDALTEGTYASATTLKDALWDYATEKGRGAVLWPLRYALTGLERSPDPFAVASILGKAETLARIDTALALPL